MTLSQLTVNATNLNAIENLASAFNVDSDVIIGALEAQDVFDGTVALYLSFMISNRNVDAYLAEVY